MLGLTVLGSGSAGNALMIHGKSGSLLLDAGFSYKELQRRLATAGRDLADVRAILVSHEHSDHTKGLRVTAKNLGVPVYCNRGTGEMMKGKRHCPDRLHLFTPGAPFGVEEFRIQAFSIPHDAMDPVGFVIEADGHRIGVATDLGHASNLVQHQLRECDILVVESNHDLELLRQSPRPWHLKQRIISRHGHLSNEASMKLLAGILHARTRHVVLAHASRECNRYELVADCARTSLHLLGRADIAVLVARQESPLPTVWL